MESKKRKPLADISNTYNLIPISTLRNVVAATSNPNPRSKPPTSILKSVSNSTNQNLCSQSSNRSDTSIGSSSNVNSARTSRTVHFRNPTLAVSLTTNKGGLGNKDVAYNGRRTAEKDKKEEKTDVPIDSPSHVGKRKDKRKAIAVPFSSSGPMRKADFLASDPTHIEKRKDKGKAVAVPFSSSVPVRKADFLVSDPTSIEKKKDKGKAVAVPSSSLVPEGEVDVLIFDPASAEKRKDKGKAIAVPFDSSVPGKEADDLIFDQTPVEKRKDKGKAIDVPFSSSLNESEDKFWTSGSPILAEKNKDKEKAIAGSSMLEAVTDYQNGMHGHYSPLKRKVQKHKLSLWPIGSGQVDMTEDFDKDALRTYTHSYEKAKLGKSVIDSASSPLGTREVTGKSIANHLNYSNERRNEENGGIDRPSTSSTVKRKEREKEIVLLPIEKEKEKGKHSLIKKTRDKGKEIIQPSTTGKLAKHKESSDTVTISRRPRRVKSERVKNDAGASSCPPPRKTRNIQNDLDEVGDDKFSNSWTDPHPKSRKKRCSRIEPTNELPQDFIKQQKAYFKEIDEFELPVEEASQDESD